MDNSERFTEYVKFMSEREDVMDVLKSNYAKFKGTSCMTPYAGKNGCLILSTSLLLSQYMLDCYKTSLDGEWLVIRLRLIGIIGLFFLGAIPRIDLYCETPEDSFFYDKGKSGYIKRISSDDFRNAWTYLENNRSEEIRSLEFAYGGLPQYFLNSSLSQKIEYYSTLRQTADQVDYLKQLGMLTENYSLI